jgi:putative transcriptional regulator
MTGDVRELLPLYALGILEADEAHVVERAVASDPALASELASYQQTAGAIGAAIEPVAPSPEVKQRLMASIGGGRFEAFSARIARMYDVTVERARELLGLIERPASWIQQVVPGLTFVDFEGGPATAGADCGFVRLVPGAVFPPHTHLGEEVTTVLAGKIHDPTHNRTIGPGDQYVQTAGTTHYLVCVGDEDCIYATLAIDGISVGGVRAQPTKEASQVKPPAPRKPGSNGDN